MSTRINNHKMCTKGSFIFLNHVHSYMELPFSGFLQGSYKRQHIKFENIRGFLRTIFENISRTFREHLHDKISTVTFCNANNKAFVSNSGPSNLPMFGTFTKT